MATPGSAALLARGGGGGGRPCSGSSAGGNGGGCGGGGCGGGGGSRRMVMRTGVQMPVLPLGTASVLPLCAGGSQRAASAASCGWCGSIWSAWRAKGCAHGNFGQALERRGLSCLTQRPKACRTWSWRSGPQERLAATWGCGGYFDPAVTPRRRRNGRPRGDRPRRAPSPAESAPSQTRDIAAAPAGHPPRRLQRRRA